MDYKVTSPGSSFKGLIGRGTVENHGGRPQVRIIFPAWIDQPYWFDLWEVEEQD